MGSNYHGYGIEVLKNFFSGRECCRSSRFPRVTMCDFEIRTMADHIHKHTIQVVFHNTHRCSQYEKIKVQDARITPESFQNQTV